MIDPYDVFDISETTIKAKKTCKLAINTKLYDDNFFTEFVDKINLPGVLQFQVPEYDDYTQIILLYPVDVMKNNSYHSNKGTIYITYEPENIIIQQEYVQDTSDVGVLNRILQGQIKYIKDPKILLNMLHDTLPSVDLIHLELILSNMFRLEDNLNIKCRIKGNYKNSVILSQRQQPKQDSWHSAMSFQHIDRAITHGLVEERNSEQNPIELVLSEKFKQI
jgi:hypothetical protein